MRRAVMRCIVCREENHADEIRPTPAGSWQCPHCGSWQAMIAVSARDRCAARDAAERHGER